ncbi:2OG-Fe(II) oxygenase family protein [Shimia aestuarii]|uniref:2-oxoglutarate-dependent ethylene/succinate-forming enzyme n=1 Tax=Shimia aestuarii TaxID=254406 RepID=A0A1I4MVY5_9RHOB|nr:2OG-Fe(II) oxygenase family protein [Shimia aestuarii]SFM07257.1 Isopenicillin N synthase [Shimia aestuarii]
MTDTPAPEIVESVDISALFGPDGAARDACVAALWDGLRRTGAVVVTGYPDADKVDARARVGLKVFDLPEDTRRAITTRHMAPENRFYYRGLWPRSPERLLQNDFYDVGPERPAPGPDLPGMEILSEPTPWPDPEPEPGWRATVRAHYAHLNRVAQAMILSIGRSAGFDEATIRARFEGDHSTLRFLSYPEGAAAADPAAGGAVVSAGRHTDASGLSLLWQAAPGLQAEGPDGVFRDIPVRENAISVHVGDVMTRLTDGAVPATPHRVLSRPGPRHSVGFFLEPALTAPVTPASHGQATGVRETYGWQLLQTFAARAQWKGVIADPDDTA